MFTTCLKTSPLLFLLVLTIPHSYSVHSFSFFNAPKVLPQKSDLLNYLKSLQRIVQFCSETKNELDLNFEFGLFLTNVNLKSVLAKKYNDLPDPIRRYITLLLKNNDDLIDFFNTMVRENHNLKEIGNMMIMSLFSNEAEWIKRIPLFHINLETDQPFRPSRWAQYIKQIDDMDSAVPSPQLSDKCLISLASNSVHSSDRTTCRVLKLCYDMLNNGTDYGYALTHRLLFLLNARYARGCSVFSYEKDARMIKSLCDIIYREAEYIANHSYGVIDLILEQISLCSLDGHAQFLQRRWLSNILRFQTSFGCFAQTRPNTQTNAKTSFLGSRNSLSMAKYRDHGRMISTNASFLRPPTKWKTAKHRDHGMLGGLCNGHVTSVAAATISAAVRYILEVFY